MRALRAFPEAVVLQHGIAYADFAPAGAKKIELGGKADRARLQRDLVGGRQRLQAAFPDQFLPVLVPPWNRIDPDVEAMLPQLGFAAISSFRGRRAPAVDGLLRIDADIDVVDWQKRRLLSPDELDRELSALGRDRGSSAMGILAHHAALGPAAVRAFCAWIATLEDRFPLAWLDPRALLAGVPA